MIQIDIKTITKLMNNCSLWINNEDHTLNGYIHLSGDNQIIHTNSIAIRDLTRELFAFNFIHTVSIDTKTESKDRNTIYVRFIINLDKFRIELIRNLKT